MVVVDWTSVDQRLHEVLDIINDPTASIVKLQQAEEEIRLVAHQLAAETAKRKLKRDRSPHNMNSRDIRAILVEAGCPTILTDKVNAVFSTVDDAHHVPKDYQPSAERIRQYRETLLELKRWVEAK
jgi:hypothetical protein